MAGGVEIPSAGVGALVVVAEVSLVKVRRLGLRQRFPFRLITTGMSAPPTFRRAVGRGPPLPVGQPTVSSCRMRLPAMKTAALASSAAALLAVAACSVPGLSQSSPSPSPLPSADITVAYGDTNGTFFLGLDQTMLVKIPNAGVKYPPLLTVAGSYSNATLLKAVATGRTIVMATPYTDCSVECNALQPMRITVVVVTSSDIEQGVTVSEQDWPSVIHVRTGQRFFLALPNPRSGPAWAQIVPANPAVIVAEQPPMTSAAGIRGQFHGGQPGRTLLRVLGPGCPPGSACPSAGSTSFVFVVFA